MIWNSQILSRDEDTICALASAQGVAGVSVLRLSGDKALELVRKLAPKLPTQIEDHKAYYVECLSREIEVLDDVVLTYFAEGHSYTGEETVEISCHGNPYIVAAILSTLVDLGARPAERGEFTYRAFMNGRLDLVQAEGVLSLIHSQSLEASKLARRQLQGHLSEKFIEIERELIWTLSRLEANIDFSMEGLEEIPFAEVKLKIEKSIKNCETLVSAYKNGRLIREGAQIAIAGLPNAGKSSLLSALLNENRAIVSSVAGTTRDTIQADLYPGPVKVTLVDTAGLRETADEIEQEGVQRSYSAIDQSELTVYVYDLNQGWTEEDQDNWNKISGKKIKLGNKRDLLSELPKTQDLMVSTQSKLGLAEFETRLTEEMGAVHSTTSAEVMQARHYDCILKIQASLIEALTALANETGDEIVALELREALGFFSELLGRDISENVVDKIFKDFCVGK